MSHRRLRSLTVVLSLALLAAACGDDDDSTADPTSGDETAPTDEQSAADCDPSPGVTDTGIAVGVLSPQSGDTGTQFLPFASGVTARLEAENAAGGVNGRTFSITEKDDGNEAATNLAAARELVKSEEVFGIIEASPRSPGSAEFLNDEGIPVTGWAINAPWGTYDNMFGYGGSLDPRPEGVLTSTGAQFMLDRGAKNLASVGFAGSPESSSAARGQAEAFEALGGEVGYLTTDVPFGSSDFTADVQRMKEAGVNALGGSITADSFVPLYLAAQQADLGLDVVLSPTGYDQRLVEAIGSQMAGVYFSIDFAPFEMELPAHEAFLDAMAEHAADEERPAQQLAMVGWLSADIFVRGVEEAGDCMSRANFVSSLRAVDDYDADGLLLKPVDQSEAFGNPSLCTNYVQVKADGSAFELVEDATPYCGEVIE